MLATEMPRSKASLQTCEPTNPFPPNTSNWKELCIRPNLGKYPKNQKKETHDLVGQKYMI